MSSRDPARGHDLPVILEREGRYDVVPAEIGVNPPGRAASGSPEVDLVHVAVECGLVTGSDIRVGGVPVKREQPRVSQARADLDLSHPMAKNPSESGEDA